MSVFKLLVKIGGDAGDLVKSMDGAVGHLKGTFGKMAEIAAGNLIADGIANMAQGMMDFARGAVDHLAEVEQINAQTAAAIRSTGGAAGVSAEQLAGLADTIERNTGVSGEMIQAGGNLLLTFTNLKNGAGAGNDVFNQTVGIMADMSVALGQDAKSSAVQLGKALNDPINGVSALQRVGVSFTDAQKEQIKAMVAAGDTMGAQKLILRELRTEFGGSAEAFGGTFRGSMEKATASLEGLGDAILGEAMPAMKGLTDFLSKTFNSLADSINELGIGGTLNKIFGPEAKAAIIGIGSAIAIALVPALAGAVTAFGVTVVAMAPFIATAAAVGGAVYLIMQNWDKITGFFKGIWNGLVGGINGLIEAFRSGWGFIGQIVQQVIAFILQKIEPIARFLPQPFKDAVKNIGGEALKLPSLVVAPIQTAAGNAATAAVNMAKGITDPVKSMTGQVQQLFSGAASTVPKLAAKMAFDSATVVDDGMGQVLKSTQKNLGDTAKTAKKAMDDTGKATGTLQVSLASLSGVSLPDAKTALAATAASATTAAFNFDSFRTSATNVQSALTGLKDGMATILDQFGVQLNDPVSQAVGKMGEFGGAVLKVASSAQDLIPAIAGLIGQISLAAIAEGAWSAAVAVATAAQWLWNVAMSANPIGLMVIGITAAIVGIGLLAKNWESVSGFLMDSMGAVGKFFQDAAGAIGHAFQVVADSIFNAFKGVFDFLLDMVKNVINATVIGPINVVIKGINAIPGPDLPEIPFLAKGGVATGATMAVIGEGRSNEAVLPLTKSIFDQIGAGIAQAPAFAGAGAGGGQAIYIEITGNRISSDRDADELGDKIVRRLRQAGVKL